jgi:aspartyl protease family protein
LFFGKLIAVVVVVALVAVAVPKFAPGVLASLVNSRSGEETVAPLDAAVTAHRVEAPLNGRQTTLRADGQGHFVVDATINGRPIEAMVDTGATIVALTAGTARRLGINPARSEFTMPIATANGVVAAAPVRLAEVRVGGIKVRDVAAVVVPDDGLPVNLLGMSFLCRLSKFELAGSRLLLVE